MVVQYFSHMKWIAILLLNVSFAASTLFNAFVVADYFVRFDYYSTVLCENQDKPELACNGKCHLALSQEQGNKQEAPLPKLKEFQVEVVFLTQNDIAFNLAAVFTDKLYVSADKIVDISLVKRLLRPPQLLF
jgi:transcriptional antiterminator Rof (Rho-off)